MSGTRTVSGQIVQLLADGPIIGPTVNQVIPSIDNQWLGQNPGYSWTAQYVQVLLLSGATISWINTVNVATTTPYIPNNLGYFPRPPSDILTPGPYVASPSSFLRITTGHARINIRVKLDFAAVSVLAPTAINATLSAPCIQATLQMVIDGVADPQPSNYIISCIAFNDGLVGGTKQTAELSIIRLVPSLPNNPNRTVDLSLGFLNYTSSSVRITPTTIVIVY